MVCNPRGKGGSKVDTVYSASVVDIRCFTVIHRARGKGEGGRAEGGSRKGKGTLSKQKQFIVPVKLIVRGLMQ